VFLVTMLVTGGVGVARGRPRRNTPTS